MPQPSALYRLTSMRVDACRRMPMQVDTHRAMDLARSRNRLHVRARALRCARSGRNRRLCRPAPGRCCARWARCASRRCLRLGRGRGRRCGGARSVVARRRASPPRYARAGGATPPARVRRKAAPNGIRSAGTASGAPRWVPLSSVGALGAICVAALRSAPRRRAQWIRAPIGARAVRRQLRRRPVPRSGAALAPCGRGVAPV